MYIKRFLLNTLTLAFYTVSLAQSQNTTQPNKLMSAAYYYHNMNNNSNAYLYIKESFKKDKSIFNKANLEFAYKISLQNNSYKYTQIFLENLVLKGAKIEELQTDSSLTQFWERKEGIKFKKKYIKLRERYVQKLDLETYSLIKHLYKLDQEIVRGRQSIEVLGIENLKKEEQYKVWWALDSAYILKKLTGLFKVKIPKNDEIGDAKEDLMLVLHHQTYYWSYSNELLPYIDKCLQDRLISNGEYYKLMDTHLVRTKRAQKYANHWKEDSNNNLVPYPISDIETLDQRRIEIGELPLGLTYNALQKNCLLPQNYKLKITIEDFLNFSKK